MIAPIRRPQVLGFRAWAQQLDRNAVELAQAAVLDIGAQDSGPDGARWALANRGVDLTEMSGRELVRGWTIRGAPHLYLRESLPSVAAAVEPFSDADAGKRIYDAAKPLKSAGISNLAALNAVAQAMRYVVTRPTTKGEVSTHVSALMDPPYLRFCRACNATHLFEMPFRLAALRAGLELDADTSPPLLRPVPDFERAAEPSPNHDVVRAYLRLLGPATAKHVADYLDAPVKDVKARWPTDTVQVSVEGEHRWVLAADADKLTADIVTTTRLLGPFDLFLQARDRPMLVDDPARAKALRPVLGRPGAVLVDGEIAGLWRPRTSGKRLGVRIALWAKNSASVRTAIAVQAERLAAYRKVPLSGIDLDG
jgi:Winged helix DNA-binding domain